MSESEMPPTDLPVEGVSPFRAGSSVPEAPTAPALYPFDRPPCSPFAQESPRLGIIHFLVAMTGVAIALSVRQFAMDLRRAEGAERVVPVAETIVDTVFGIGSGLALASLGLAAARWRRRQCYPAWPGEWLLLNAGLCTFVGLSLWMALQIALKDRHDFETMRWYYAASILLPLPLHVVAAVRVRIRPWRVYFTVSALAACCLGPGVFAIPFYWMSSNCITIADIPRVALLLFAMGGDVARRRQLPWTHWFGAGLLAFILGLSAVWGLLSDWFR